MQVVGITGTNGKTTTAYLIASIFEAAGVRCGVLGTVAYRVGDELREATRTTPEAPEVQGCFGKWSTGAAEPARWKCRRTRCRSAAWTG